MLLRYSRFGRLIAGFCAWLLVIEPLVIAYTAASEQSRQANNDSRAADDKHLRATVVLGPFERRTLTYRDFGDSIDARLRAAGAGVTLTNPHDHFTIEFKLICLVDEQAVEDVQRKRCFDPT